jgi:nucleoside-diphosphate-sugar epimerase
MAVNKLFDLGWKPKTKLEDGIAIAYNDFKNGKPKEN